MELDKTEYLASTDDANVVERLVQAREQLKDCLMRGKAAVGYWQVQIHDDAIALIASQAAEVARLEALVVSRVRASADAIVEIASQAAEIAALKAEIAKLTGRVSDRQKLNRLLGERDEWRQELDNLRRLLRRAERGVAEEHSWYVAAEASLSARTDEIDQLTRLNAALEDALKRLGGAPMRLNAETHHD